MLEPSRKGVYGSLAWGRCLVRTRDGEAQAAGMRVGVDLGRGSRLPQSFQWIWGRDYSVLSSHHTAEASLDESRCQAVHSNVLWGQLCGKVLSETQQSCFANIVRAQRLGEEEN